MDQPLIGMSACLQRPQRRPHRANLLSLHEPGRRDRKGMGRAGRYRRSPVSPGRLGRKLSFPAGILNFESSCGVCDSWGWARVGRRDCGGQAMMDACWARLVIAALQARSAWRSGEPGGPVPVSWASPGMRNRWVARGREKREGRESRVGGGVGEGRGGGVGGVLGAGGGGGGVGVCGGGGAPAGGCCVGAVVFAWGFSRGGGGGGAP